MTLDRCLTESEIAQYADFLCHEMEKPEEELLDKIKALAWWERITLKEIVNTALREYVGEYESKNGAIKPIVKK